MRNLPVRKVQLELTEYFKSVMARDNTLPELDYHPDALRVSGFPYCGLKHLYEKLTLTEEKAAAKKSTDGGKMFYTTVGTAAHLAFQRFMAQRGRILGNWKCYKCKHVELNQHVIRCPKCGSEMEYEEFDVKIFNHVSGHLDGIYQASDGRYFLIDYKTSSVRAIWAHKKRKTFPYAKNVAQITAYCAIFERLYGIKISGWFLLYIARDHPTTTLAVVGDEISDSEKHRILKRIRRWDKHYGIVWSGKSWNEMKVLVAEKPCKSYDFYSQNYKGFKSCPLEGVCFTKNLTEHMRNTWDDEKKMFFVRRKKELAQMEAHRKTVNKQYIDDEIN